MVLFTFVLISAIGIWWGDLFKSLNMSFLGYTLTLCFLVKKSLIE